MAATAREKERGKVGSHLTKVYKDRKIQSLLPLQGFLGRRQRILRPPSSPAPPSPLLPLVRGLGGGGGRNNKGLLPARIRRWGVGYGHGGTQQQPLQQGRFEVRDSTSFLRSFSYKRANSVSGTREAGIGRDPPLPEMCSSRCRIRWSTKYCDSPCFRR